MMSRDHQKNDRNGERDHKGIKASIEELQQKLDAPRKQDIPGILERIAVLEVRIGQLERIVNNDMNQKLDALRTQDVPGILAEIAGLKVRTSVWGGIVALIVSAVVNALISYFLR